MKCTQSENVIVEKVWALAKEMDRHFDPTIPTWMDKLSHVIAIAYSHCEEDIRDRIRYCISDGTGKYLMPFTERLCTMALNSLNKKYLLSSILLQSMENSEFDARENMRYFPIIWFSCKQMNIDPESLFIKVADISSNKFSRVLRDYCDTPESNKSLKGVHISYVQISGGHFEFRYQ